MLSSVIEDRIEDEQPEKEKAAQLERP